MASELMAALDSHSVFIECSIIRCLTVLHIGWSPLGAEKAC